ncbi:MAG: tetratricopeptide repeat protein [Myxococcaceae bacterium]|nr:tetratricopeptide repeat protein [Myxococcaceae bacterium]
MAPVHDIAAKDFETAVLAKSHDVPVVVDFWAGWCAPCRMLGPTLEREVEALNGRVLLAKVDVDQAQDLAAAYQVQGIPAVKAFRQGKVVAEFTGARDAGFVRKWLAGIAPSERQQALERASSVELLTPLLDDAEVGLAAALKLAALHLASGKPQAAGPLLERVPMHHALHDRAEALRQQARLAEAASALGDEASLKTRLERDAMDVEARFALACVFASRGDDLHALEQFLEVVTARKARREDARKAMLAVFDRLGGGSPLTQQFRRRLQAVL